MRKQNIHLVPKMS